MAPIPSSSKVLVTGANGYLACWIAKVILDRGHNVIGTVRSPSKGEYLKKLFGDKFSYVLIDDIAKPGAFDEAIKLGVDGVVHTASPVSTAPGGDPALFLGPAVKGTTGILESVSKYGPTVKRVVITSSVAACLGLKEGQYTYTEADWNEDSPGIVEKEGTNAGWHLYRASKVLSERAAWEFVKKQDSFDLVTILPSGVFGPLIHEVNGVDSLNATSRLFWNNATLQDDPVKGKGISLNFVDVRDNALAHAVALESPDAGGERFLVNANTFTWQDQKDILTEAGFTEVAEGTPGSGKTHVPEVFVDGSKATRLLGVTYRQLEEVTVDMYKSLKERLAV